VRRWGRSKGPKKERQHASEPLIRLRGLCAVSTVALCCISPSRPVCARASPMTMRGVCDGGPYRACLSADTLAASKLDAGGASCELRAADDELRLIAVDCRCKGHDVGGELQVINPTSNACAIGSCHIDDQCSPLTCHPCVSGVPGSVERGSWYWAVPHSRNQIPMPRARNLLVSTPVAVIPPTVVYSK
jgi:hypothetical protein